MAMDIGPWGGTGYDSSTHRSGTDWNKNGSIDMADGAMGMLVMDHVMNEEGDNPSEPNATWSGYRKAKPESKLRDWIRRHYILVTMVTTFVVTFLICMLFK